MQMHHVRAKKLQRQEQMGLRTQTGPWPVQCPWGEALYTNAPEGAPPCSSLLARPPVPWKHRRSWAGLFFIVRLEWVNLLTSFFPGSVLTQVLTRIYYFI